jgi:hypothetical protein
MSAANPRISASGYPHTPCGVFALGGPPLRGGSSPSGTSALRADTSGLPSTLFMCCSAAFQLCCSLFSATRCLDGWMPRCLLPRVPPHSVWGLRLCLEVAPLSRAVSLGSGWTAAPRRVFAFRYVGSPSRHLRASLQRLHVLLCCFLFPSPPTSLDQRSQPKPVPPRAALRRSRCPCQRDRKSSPKLDQRLRRVPTAITSPKASEPPPAPGIVITKG